MKSTVFSNAKLILAALAALLAHTNVRAQQWTEIMKGVAADRSNYTTVRRETGDQYGFAVSVSGDYAVVGALGSGPVLEGEYTPEGLAYILQKTGTGWKQVMIIRSPTKDQDGSRFGAAVSISGDHVIVGAPLRDEEEANAPENTLPNAGAAFIYRKDQGGPNKWGLVRKLNAPDRSSDDEFGVAVCVRGDYVIVGAHRAETDASNANPVPDAGAAYIFQRNQGGTDNWGQIRKITAPGRAAHDHFGGSVAMESNYAVVGAPFSGEAGAAYIFRGNRGGAGNWGFSARLVSQQNQEGEAFGSSVAMSGNYVLAGAPVRKATISPGTNAADAGAACVFVRNENNPDDWTLVREVASQDPGQLLGAAVAIDGSYAVIGAPGTPAAGDGVAGVAYILGKDQGSSGGWGTLKQITADRAGSAANNDGYGFAVGISGVVVMVGAKDDGDRFFGAVYMHEQNQGGTDQFGQLAVMMSMHPDIQDYFGQAVAMKGNFAVVSAVGDTEDENGQNPVKGGAGSVYLLQNNGTSWQQIRKIVAPDRSVSAGFGVSVAISENYLVVGATGKKAAYVYGRNYGGSGNWGLIRKIESPNAADDGFGTAVSITDTYLMVGAPRNIYEVNGNEVFGGGTAYIYKQDFGGADHWGLLKSIQAPVHDSFDNFGFTVSIDGETGVIGAPSEFEDEAEANPVTAAGAAYIVQMSAGGTDHWGLVRKIVANERVAYAGFGSAAAISGDYIVVGAPADFTTIQEPGQTGETFLAVGAAHIFSRNQGGPAHWGFVKKLFDPTPNEEQKFGASVAISNDVIVVGTPVADDGISPAPGVTPINAGSAFIFRKNEGGNESWGLFQEIRGSDYTYNDRFGTAVGVSGRYILSGAPAVDTDEQTANYLFDAGAIYMFDNEDGALPVTLAAFTAAKSEDEALLSWEVASEIHSAYFDVQRSMDTQRWETLGIVAAAGHSVQTTRYTLRDSRPEEGVNFYRLKMVDQDGTFAYSSICRLTFDQLLRIAVYPNPGTDRVYFSGIAAGQLSAVQIHDLRGQTVLKHSGHAGAGVSVGQLVPGRYIIQLMRKNGSPTFRSLIIAR